MTDIDIKTMRKTAKDCLKHLHADTPHPTNWIVQMHPATLIDMCDEIERLRKENTKLREEAGWRSIVEFLESKK